MCAAQPAPFGPLGEIELLADEDRPGGWLLLIDRIRQSYIDLEDPTYLDFEYIQAFADVVDALPPGPLHVTHVGGGGCTFARYVSATRPRSTHVVLEPDAAVTAFVRARLPFARGTKIKIRAEDGRRGIAKLASGSADVLVLDAFHGGRVPAEVTTTEFVADVVRVLAPYGVLLANVADGPPVSYTRRLAVTLAEHFRSVLVVAEPAVLRGRRHGNVVMAAGRELPIAAVRRASARAAFPRSVTAGEGLRRFAAGARPLTDAASMRSPIPPDDMWRVGD